MLRPWLTPLALGALLALLPRCSKEALPPDQVDTDSDAIPDQSEDRNQNGTVDPGETNPNVADTDGDGIPDDREVEALACSKVNDRPFFVFDVVGADSLLLMDAKVSERSMLRTADGRAPGAIFADPELDVAATLIGKRPANGVGTPSAQRDYEQRTVISRLGQITGQRTRAFTTAEGFAAEQASYKLEVQATTSRALANQLGSGLLGGATLTGTLGPGGASDTEATVNLLTVYRNPNLVVIVAAVALGNNGDAALIRVDELTDGTNVARHGSFTRHVCDPFIATERAKADILWVIDDSGSMEDDQMAVRQAADAMAEILTSGGVDYRLGVARTFAQDQNSNQRGRLEGQGFTSDLDEFRDDVVVGAQGGWEPGLETALLAFDRASPGTAPGAAADPRRVREDASKIVIYMSDERDQTVECAACGRCPNEPEPRNQYCAGGDVVIDDFIAEYRRRNIVSFAIVGDLPNGCQQSRTRDDFEPGQGYVEVANATGGQFGSLCGDMRQNLQDVARAATGIASSYQLSAIPASATLKVAIGQPGNGRVIPRSRTNGFDYDAVNNRIVFYGDALPKKGDEIVVGYRKWDWANNPGTPDEGCDHCEVGSACAPDSDLVECRPGCGEVVCDPGLVCLPDTAACGEPGQLPPPTDACGGCDAGLVCNAAEAECVVPCEQTGCTSPQFCSASTHLCTIPNF